MLVLVLAGAGALQAAEVRVLPASSNVLLNDTFALTVSVDQAAGLGGFQFKFSYDPAILSVTEVKVNNAFDLPVVNQFNNTAGTGLVAASVFSSPSLSDINLQLAVITFTVKASGSSNIGLTNVILGKIGGDEIASTATDGTVTNNAQALIVTNIVPALKSIITSPNVAYTLSEDALTCTVSFTRTGGAVDGALHTYSLTGAELLTGSHTVVTNMTLVNGTFYTVMFQFQDKAGNPPATVSNRMVFYDTNYGNGRVGDIANEDGLNMVNEADVAKMLSVMGSRPGDSNWNPSCDLNKDNRIDQKDLMILRMHFGE